MPFASKAQARKCFAAGSPTWDCREWARATPSIKKLPDRKTPHRKEALDMTAPVSVIAALGRQAAEKPLVEKLAADTGLAPAAVQKLAAAANLGVADLARAAYRNPQAFAKFAQAHLGPKPAAPAKPAAKPAVKAASLLETTFVAVAKKAIEKKAAAAKKLSAMTLMNHFLDKVAAALPVTKQASVRVLQAELALGKPLSFAIKRAYPTLTPERRGIVAGKLVKAASDDFAKFVKKKRSGPETATGKPGSPEVAKMMKAAAPAPAQVLEDRRDLGPVQPTRHPGQTGPVEHPKSARVGRTVPRRDGRDELRTAPARGADECRRQRPEAVPRAGRELPPVAHQPPAPGRVPPLLGDLPHRLDNQPRLVCPEQLRHPELPRPLPEGLRDHGEPHRLALQLGAQLVRDAGWVGGERHLPAVRQAEFFSQDRRGGAGAKRRHMRGAPPHKGLSSLRHHGVELNQQRT
jgi:hypothetical protein